MSGREGHSGPDGAAQPRGGDHGADAPDSPRDAAPSALPLLQPATVEEWRNWLTAHHADSRGVWVAIGKKGTKVTTLDYESAVNEALCFGWIDGQSRRLDGDRYLQRMTPRKRGSDWAPSNKARVAELGRRGRLAPPGIAAIERAKADGSWTSLDDIEAMIVPDDLAAALAARPPAERNFAALPASARKMALYRISKARASETRAARIAETVSAAIDARSPS